MTRRRNGRFVPGGGGGKTRVTRRLPTLMYPVPGQDGHGPKEDNKMGGRRRKKTEKIKTHTSLYGNPTYLR